MGKIWCSHKMNTTKFVCKDPDASNGRRFYIEVVAGQRVKVDERIIEAYPGVFTPTEKPSEPVVESVEEDAAIEPVEEPEADSGADVAEEPEIEPDVEEEAPAEEVEILSVDQKADLANYIDGFTAKKKLDLFGEEQGVTLDRRMKLAEMKETLKAELDLI